MYLVGIKALQKQVSRPLDKEHAQENVLIVIISVASLPPIPRRA